MIEVGMLGFGTVGQGVYRILQNKSEEIAGLVGDEIQISKILVRSLDKERKTSVDSTLLTLDPEEVVKDEEIQVVVEVTGDVELSYRLIKESLEKGKHVITANKALVSAYFEELSHLAEEKGVSFLYEASVAGGIPVIKPLKDQIRLNKVSRIQGILNGTCNYILTRMTDYGLTYEDALKEAQDLGYAEADPSADVEGIDTMRKLRILGTIAMGASITEDDIICDGIDSITDLDIGVLKARGRKVKLIAEALEREEGYQAIVQPKAVSLDNYFSGVNLADNSVSMECDNTGKLGFQGPGAGMFPTANAVLTDLLDCLMKNQPLENPLRSRRLENRNQEISGNYYLRISDYDEKVNIPDSLIKEVLYEREGQKAIFTEEAKLFHILDMLAESSEKPFALIAMED